MTFRKSFLAAIAILAITVSSFATSTYPTYDTNTSSTKAYSEIKTIIKAIDFNVVDLDEEKIKVRFMINSDNEVIVLHTNNEKLDSFIKSTLNYRSLKNDDLKVNQIYIMPITFKNAASS